MFLCLIQIVDNWQVCVWGDETNGSVRENGDVTPCLTNEFNPSAAVHGGGGYVYNAHKWKCAHACAHTLTTTLIK